VAQQHNTSKVKLSREIFENKNRNSFLFEIALK
jgi:hypothetical protein